MPDSPPTGPRLTLAAWAAMTFAAQVAWRRARMRPVRPGGTRPAPAPLRAIVGWVPAARTGDVRRPHRQREVLACGHLGGWRRIGSHAANARRCTDCAWGLPPFADLP